MHVVLVVFEVVLASGVNAQPSWAARVLGVRDCRVAVNGLKSGSGGGSDLGNG